MPPETYSSSMTGGCSVRKVDHATGLITTVAGDGTGNYHASGDGGPATAAGLAAAGIAVDAAGDLYIAENRSVDRLRRGVIREVNHATGVIISIAGNGTYGISGDGGPAAAGQVECPMASRSTPTATSSSLTTGRSQIREVANSLSL